MKNETKERIKRWCAIWTVLPLLIGAVLILDVRALDKKLVCTIQEHTHSAACYETVLSCGMDETEPHAHDENCYEEESVLICTEPEEAHVHGEECYQEEETYLCSQEEGEGHTHKEECYTQGDKLICGFDREHTHTADCYSNPNADVENQAMWDEMMAKLPKSGVWADDLVGAAASQIGYAESRANYIIGDDGRHYGYTRYGDWYGIAYGDWCAMYVSFCLHYSDIPEEYMPQEASCRRWVEALKKMDLYRSADEYTPTKGDIIFFDHTGDGIANHVGIVKDVSEDGIATIEGNYGDKTAAVRYVKGDTSILGYGELEKAYARCQQDTKPVEEETPEDEISEETNEPEEPEKEPTTEPTEIVTEYEEVSVKLAADAGVFLKTEEPLKLMITEPDDSVQKMLQGLTDKNPSYFAADIKIMDGGSEVQPDGKVTITFVNAVEKLGTPMIRVYHLKADAEAPEEMTVSVEDNGDVVMETEHFSTYVLVGEPVETYVDTNSEWYQRRLDNSNDIGVRSEGYADSTANVDKKLAWGVTFITGVMPGTWFDGGTIMVNGINYHDQYALYNEQPVRITSADPAKKSTLSRSTYANFLANNTVAPNGAIKIDNVKYNTVFKGEYIWARGNKFVIGEGVETQSGKEFVIHGGSLINDATTTTKTNVVVASGRWNRILGGGSAKQTSGTQVTVRGNPYIEDVYGGGDDTGDVGNVDIENSGVTVNIEGGTIEKVFGGNATNKTGIKVNADIDINVSGGYIGVLQAGNEQLLADNEEVLKGSKVRGCATVNIMNTGSAERVTGDPYRNWIIDGESRLIKGVTTLNVTAPQDFAYMEYFDVVNISGENVVVSADSQPGSGYLGRISVKDSGTLFLDDGGIINITGEEDKEIKPGYQFSAPYFLKHAWEGEESVEERSQSTLAIDGKSISPSNSTTFNPGTDRAGLLINGNVEGFSTLEARGDLKYSDGEHYYYYVVADSSDNGGKAFKEPEGAPYTVCYRTLADGRIGWYLRERPSMEMKNVLVRVGTGADGQDTTEHQMVLHVEMNGFAYEWSSTSEKNRVDFNWDIYSGSDAAVKTSEAISLATLADIENNPDGIFTNIQFDGTGTDEGSDTPSKRLKSFDVIIDKTEAKEARYYDLDANFHYVRDNGDGTVYDDIRIGDEVDGARCTYDFAKPGEYYGDDGYEDSIMKTTPYEDDKPPVGADEALLRLYIPYGLTASSFEITEAEGKFVFTKGTEAQLTTMEAVTTNYSTATAENANSRYALRIGDDGLYDGVSKTNVSQVQKYICKVGSQRNVNIEDITKPDEEGICLKLNLTGITKDGKAVGAGNPETVNKGELQIQTVPLVYQITYDSNDVDCTVPTDENSYKYGDEAVIGDAPMGQPPEKAFAGWNTETDGTGTTYMPGEKIEVTDNTTLYAVWSTDVFAVQKVWQDGKDKYGLRPESVEVQLQKKDADGNYEDVPGQNKVVNAANNWRVTFEVDPKENQDDYRVVETDYIKGYKMKISRPYAFQITNMLRTASIELKKVDAETDKPLANAVFRLEYQTNAGEKPYWEVSTDAQGYLTFTDLPIGIYRLSEVKAPIGYRLALHEWTVEITDPNTAWEGTAPLEVKIFDKENREILLVENGEFKISNTKVPPLPSVGGFGVPMYYLFAAGLMIFALGGCWIRNRRRKKTEGGDDSF